MKDIEMQLSGKTGELTNELVYKITRDLYKSLPARTTSTNDYSKGYLAGKTYGIMYAIYTMQDYLSGRLT